MGFPECVTLVTTCVIYEESRSLAYGVILRNTGLCGDRTFNGVLASIWHESRLLSSETSFKEAKRANSSWITDVNCCQMAAKTPIEESLTVSH